MNTLYQDLVAAGIPTDNHESDLYFPVTKDSCALLLRHERQVKGTVTVFTSEIDGQQWYDVPFAYDPWWEKRAAESRPA